MRIHFYEKFQHTLSYLGWYASTFIYMPFYTLIKTQKKYPQCTRNFITTCAVIWNVIVGSINSCLKRFISLLFIHNWILSQTILFCYLQIFKYKQL